MDHRPQAWGRPRDDVYGAYDASHMNPNGPNQASQSPIVTGTSVIAIKYSEGVVIAADNLASYGSLARFTNVKRLRTFAESTVIGFGGDESAAKLTRQQAEDVIKECMKVLYYRDARSLDSYSIAVVTKDGVELKEDEKLEKQSWAFAEKIRGYGTQTV
ncbi:hypothetical protein VdG1_01436 [Verticillium dahliae VDG1]|nr:hypothetical protein VdG1_01436 [Verticillium dahliae VDG1]